MYAMNFIELLCSWFYLLVVLLQMDHVCLLVVMRLVLRSSYCMYGPRDLYASWLCSDQLQNQVHVSYFIIGLLL